MKTILTFAAIFMIVSTSTAVAAETTVSRASQMAALQEIEQRITHIRMLILARVLGASTSNYFEVTSNGNVIAQSYVPVSTSVAQAWCADMVAMPSFKGTDIECTHDGIIIY